MSRMQYLRRIGPIMLCLGLVLAVSGCIPMPWLEPSPPAETPPDLAGHWMSVEIIPAANEEEEETSAQVDTDFWEFTPLSSADGVSTYMVTYPCEPGNIVAYAYLYEGHTVVIEHPDSGASLTAILNDDDTDTLHALDLVDDSAWTAYRIEEPACTDVDQDGTLDVGFQPIELEDVAYDGPEEEELIQARTVVAASTSPNGLAHLTESLGSRLTMGEEYVKPVGEKTETCSNMGSPVECDPSGPHPGYVMCVDQGMSEAKIQELANVVALLDTDQVYPGALLRGSHFDGGSFVPITIPRDGGTITMSGLYGSNANFKRTLEEISYANVHNAIMDLLSANNIQGTAANASHRVDVAHSASQWAFDLGIDVKFVGGDVKTSVEAGRDSETNTVVMKFAQVFYIVSFQDPTLRTDVFAAGENFDDPEDQIGRGNPPLYVSNVKYGRQVFFTAQSKLSSSYVKAALSGAYNGVAASVSVDSGMSYKDIMKNTTITYIVRGGDAGLALEPINSATPDQMYDKIKNFLANRNAAVWSPQNPGIPVAYTLRYLDDRTVALKGLSTTYDRKDCHTMEGVQHQYNLVVDKINCDIKVWLDYKTDATSKAFRTGGKYAAAVNNWIPGDGRDHKVIVQLRNSDCFGSGADFGFRRDGVPVHDYSFHPKGWRCCGKQVEIHYLVNPNTGAFSVPYLWYGNGVTTD